VSGGFTFSAVRAGYVSSCGLTTTDQPYCWGSNESGQIGDGSDGESPAYETPQAVVGGHTFVALDLLSSHACALTADGQAYCWGRNDDGQLGDGSESPGASRPVQVASSVPFVQVTVGVWHSCGLTAGGEAWCWGLNHSGQLGDGSVSSSLAPVKVVGGLTFTSSEAGGFHTCGITQLDQGHCCWGENGDGRLGSGSCGDGSQSIVPWPVAQPEGP
jgi:alpha-tubulin suppressor-like RCC1 family protein